ncbi:MAG: hypothetical protein Kow0031_21160 [Anaerolineae bacterium]
MITFLFLAGAALAQEEPKTPVLVMLRPAEMSAQGVERAQRQVLDELPPEQGRVRHRFERLPGMAVDVTAAGLEALRRNPAVLAVSEDLPVRAALADSAAFIGAVQARQEFGVTGGGIGVAVLDSGIDTDHPDFGGRIIAQHCFNKGNTCPPGNTAESDSAEDANGHGTHVAGIVAGGGLVAPPGIAPGANLVAVRVLDGGGAGYTSDVLAGIDWVVSRQAELNVKVINLSLGGGSYSGVCDQADANTLLYAAAVAAARAAGISLFAAAGNSGQADGLLTPACVGGVMAVGNVYNDAIPQGAWPACTDNNILPDTVACSSNSSDELDLLAPGTLITAAGLGGGTRTESGTSMATPHAAGLAALLLESDSGLLPDALEALLKATGVPVTDTRTGRTTPRINALAAVTALQPAPPLTGTVRLQGRSVFSGTAIFSGAACEGIEQNEPAAMTDPTGGFSLAQPVGCVLAAHPGYLSALAEAPAGSLGEVLLPVGDLNGDGVINILDLSLIARAFKSSDSAADVDASGVVDIFDLVLTARNFNLQGPVAWPAE